MNGVKSPEDEWGSSRVKKMIGVSRVKKMEGKRGRMNM